MSPPSNLACRLCTIDEAYRDRGLVESQDARRFGAFLVREAAAPQRTNLSAPTLVEHYGLSLYGTLRIGAGRAAVFAGWCRSLAISGSRLFGFAFK